MRCRGESLMEEW
ncbi:hypothetical protein TIFTF001_043879 [Ficus carica]|uniref:Uncharacterized protein n=1 Tax=Ficus carica TaxID=3494 RepID=A0AA88D2W1_FICCA|nr:hypothetical protein TIFTF001_043879 [Ficus carica]